MLTLYSMELVVLILFNMVISYITPMSDASLICYCSTLECSVNNTCWTEGACAIVQLSQEPLKVETKCLNSESLNACSHADTFCCYNNRCNTNDLITDNSSTDDSLTVKITFIIIASIIIIACLALFVIILVIASVFLLRRKRRNSNRRTQVGVEACNGHRIMCAERNHVEAIVPKGQSICDLIQQAVQLPNTGQLSLLMQKNIVRSTATSKHIHSGRFSEVYVGKWREENVCVKVYPTNHQDEWYKEVGVYQMPHFHHENILQFIAADHRRGPNGLECWLVTVHHDMGSMRNFLAENSVEVESCVKMCWSVASGLAFLHEFRSTLDQDKPSIVHRNLTSTNILLKSNSECCLADMSCCVALSPQNSEITRRLKVHSQDIRYRPPEFLSPSDVSDEGFHAHMRGDVYSLGIVLWEICRRCNIDGQFHEALLPYQEELPINCSEAEAQIVISAEGRRPKIPELWGTHKVMKPLSIIISDCWSENSLSRPQSSAVRDTIAEFLPNVNFSSILSEKFDKVDGLDQKDGHNSFHKVLT